MVEWPKVRFAVAVVTLLLARDAGAQSQQRKGRTPAPPAPTLSHTNDAAAERMRAGDCAGALDALDAALRTSIRPELYRDRGACHEKLGQPFPAIEDYRTYLLGRPDAPDADAIRARVAALEAQVGIVKHGQEGVSGKTGAEVSTSIGGETDLGEPTGGSGPGLETIERNELLDAQADGSPLRRGHGIILGLAVGGHYYASDLWGGGEFAGFDVRYGFGVHEIMLEASIAHVNGGGTVSALSGPGILGGYQLRIPLNARVSDALLLGATFRYESLSEANSVVFATLEPEGRFGYRHVFGPAFGLEAVVDGGVAFAEKTGFVDANSTIGLVGGHVAVVVGF